MSTIAELNPLCFLVNDISPILELLPLPILHQLILQLAEVFVGGEGTEVLLLNMKSTFIWVPET
ncbi:MAG: hypothetical protein WC294_00295 [Methanoregula sp.]